MKNIFLQLDSLVLPKDKVSGLKAGQESAKKVLTNTITQSLQKDADIMSKLSVLVGGESISKVIEGAVSAASMTLNGSRSLTRPTCLFPDEPVIVGGKGNLKAGQESFGGKDPSLVQKLTIAGAILGAVNDRVLEQLFPTFTIDPQMSGFVLSSRTLKLSEEIRRTHKTSTPSKITSISLAKAVRNPKLLNPNANDLIFTYDPMSNSNFYEGLLSTFVNYKGERITTAPLMFGVEVPLLDLSQSVSTESQNTKSQRNELDVVQVTKFHINVAPEGETKELLPLDIEALNSVFTGTMVGGRAKGINYFLKTSILTFNTSKTMHSDDTPANVDGAIFADLAVNHTIVLGVEIYGHGDVETGNIKLTGDEIKIIRIEGPTGKEVDMETGDGKAIVDALADMQFSSYEVRANETNQNVSDNGFIGTIEYTSKEYPVRYRSSSSLEHPIVESELSLTTYNALTDKLTIIKAASRNDGFNILNAFFNTMSIATATKTSDDMTDFMLSSDLITPVTIDETISITTVLDSIKSSEREADLMGALTGIIKNTVAMLNTESGYGAALATENPGEKIVVNISGSDDIISYVDSSIDLGDSYKVKIASTDHISMIDTLIITFGTENPIKDNSVDILNFGVKGTAPTGYYDLNVSGNNEQFAKVHTTPRYNYYVLTAIGARFKIANIAGARTYKVTNNSKFI